MSSLQVRLQSTVIPEGPAANVARVWPLLGVNSLMHAIGFLRLEALSANVALVVTRIGVHRGVLVQLGSEKGTE